MLPHILLWFLAEAGLRIRRYVVVVVGPKSQRLSIQLQVWRQEARHLAALVSCPITLCSSPSVLRQGKKLNK